MKYFRALVTADLTASALIPIQAENKEEAMGDGLLSENEIEFWPRFEINDGASSELYYGDPEKDVEEISQEEYENLVNADQNVYLVIQEGGSSQEFYLHVHESKADAEEDRMNCAVEGSYRTAPVLPVPRVMANHPDFTEVAETLVKSVFELEYADAE